MKYFIINSIDWEDDLKREGWEYDGYLFNNVQFSKNDSKILVDAEVRDGCYLKGDEKLPKSFKIKS